MSGGERGKNWAALYRNRDCVGREWKRAAALQQTGIFVKERLGETDC